MTMKVQVAILASLLPVAFANFLEPGYRLNCSIQAFDSMVIPGFPDGFYCTGPYCGGMFSDPNISHPFYFGADCFVADGQPLGCFCDVLGGFINCYFLVYIVSVLRKQVGYSPYLRDFALYFFWQTFAFWGGSIFHTLAYVGSQYENVADVPNWVTFVGFHTFGVHFNGDTGDSWIMIVICLRLLFEPCFPCKTGYLWAIFHAWLYVYLIPSNLIGHFVYRSDWYPMGEYHDFTFQGYVALLLYGIVRCKENRPALITGVIMVIGYAGYIPNFVAMVAPNFAWKYCNDMAFGHAMEFAGNYGFFVVAVTFLRNKTVPFMEPKTSPLLM